MIVIWGFGKAHNRRQDRYCFLFNNVSIHSVSFFNGAFVSPKYYFIYCGTGYLWGVMSINWLIIFTCRKLVLDAITSIFLLSIANFITYYKHRPCAAIVSFDNDNIMIVLRLEWPLYNNINCHYIKIIKTAYTSKNPHLHYSWQKRETFWGILIG